jgi:hypothetical protein
MSGGIPLAEDPVPDLLCPMAATRRSALWILVPAALFLIALGGAAWAMVPSGHGGGHAGGSRGGHFVGFPGFTSSTFPGRPFGHHRFAHRRHGRGSFPYVDYGYGGGYDVAYGTEDYEPPAPRPQGYPHSGYCDVVPGSYPQDCVWKKGP